MSSYFKAVRVIVFKLSVVGLIFGFSFSSALAQKPDSTKKKSASVSTQNASTATSHSAPSENSEKPAIPTASQTIQLLSPVNPSIGLDYPELLVVPKASERIATESASERNQYLRFWAYQVSAIMTLSTSFIIHSELNSEIASGRIKEKSETALITQAIPAAWIVGTLALNFMYKPYDRANRKVGGMPVTTPRERLAKERAAEEYLDSAASFGRTLSWFSFASNFATSLVLVRTATDIKISDPRSTALTMVGVSVLASALPLLFPGPWVDIRDTQESYKKRIYGPIGGIQATPGILQSSTLLGTRGGSVPGILFSYQF